MSTWSEVALKLELKNFEDGLNDARCHSVDELAYQINREYRTGVDIAQQLMKNLDVARNQTLNRQIGRHEFPVVYD